MPHELTPQEQERFLEELMCPECKVPLQEKVEDDLDFLECPECEFTFVKLQPDQQIFDLACMKCTWEFSAVVPADFNFWDIPIESCEECGDFILPLI